MKLVNMQYRLEYLDGRVEDVMFSARSIEVAAQALANRCLMKETPLKKIIAPDGQEFKILNEAGSTGEKKEKPNDVT